MAPRAADSGTAPMIDGELGRAAFLPRLVAHPARTVRALAVEAQMSAASVAVYAAASIWAALFGAVAWARYDGFVASRFDLGDMVQAVWSTAHGHPLRVTLLHGSEVIRTAVHVDVILAALAPLWLIWPSPVMLLVIQTGSLALGALPVYWLARKHLGSARLGAALACVYLVYPPVQWIDLVDFHAVTLAVPLFLFAIWFLDEDRLVPFAVVAVLALATKEEIGLALAGLGLWFAVRRGRPLAGAVIAAGGVAWSLIALEVVVPLSSGGQPSPYLARYAAVGGSPVGFFEKLATDPAAIVAAVTTHNDITYLVLLLSPLLALWALEPWLAAAALPELGLNLLSSNNGQVSIMYHYSSGIIPFVVAASVIGLGRLRRHHPKAMRLAVVSLIASTALGMLLAGPLTIRGPEIARALGSAHARAAQRAVDFVPAGDAVSSTNQLGAHLSARRKIYVFPVLRDAHWIVVDRNDQWHTAHGDPIWSRRFARQLAGLGRDPRFDQVFQQEGISVYVRRNARTAQGIGASDVSGKLRGADSPE